MKKSRKSKKKILRDISKNSYVKRSVKLAKKAAGYSHLPVLLLVFVFSFNAVSPSFNDGFIHSWDNPSHLVKSRAFWDNLDLESLGIWGWFPDWYLGTDPFIFYAPGFFIIVSLVRILSLDILTLDMSMKLVVAVSCSILPLALYGMCRNFGFNKASSLLAAVFSMTIMGKWGVGIESSYIIGLYPSHMGALLSVVFLGLFHKAMNARGDKPDRTYLLAGFLLGFLILTHTISAAYTLSASLLYILVRHIYKGDLPYLKLLIVFLTAFLLAVFWLYPLVTSYYLLGPEAGFAPLKIHEVATNILSGNMLGSPFTSNLMLFGAAFMILGVIFRRDKSMASLYLLALFVFTILISSDLIASTLAAANVNNPVYKFITRIFRLMYQTRTLSFVAILIPVIAAKGIGDVIDLASYVYRWLLLNLARPLSVKLGHARIGKFAARLSRINLVAVPAAIAILLLLNSYSEEQKEYAKPLVKTLANYSKGYPTWQNAFDWLKANASEDSLVKVDVDFTRIDYPGFLGAPSILNLETGLRTVTGNQIELIQVDLCGYGMPLNYLNATSDKILKERLHTFDVDYLFLAGKGDLDKDYLTKIYSRDKIDIYQVGYLGEFDHEIREMSITKNRYDMTIDSKKAQLTTLPVQYNDHWIAKVNGVKQELQRVNGLIALDLSEGVNGIELRFERKTIETILFFVSLATLIALPVLWKLNFDINGIEDRLKGKIKRLTEIKENK